MHQENAKILAQYFLPVWENYSLTQFVTIETLFFSYKPMIFSQTFFSSLCRKINSPFYSRHEEDTDVT